MAEPRTGVIVESKKSRGTLIRCGTPSRHVENRWTGEWPKAVPGRLHWLTMIVAWRDWLNRAE